ncbi:OX-2 membrane glycoprotein-like isoform X2 [Vombatus ursinus]|uniref:Ig-like domain-containing protein n=1 Tax=Vombatus ursinus TaxID=29139 RepID=A0A4X2L3E0_VOMUR|nr:OX-2 membrane glycoprotein-like isoform X2 [Vombatus ursinus]
MLSLLWSFLLSLLRTEGAVSDSLFVTKNKSTDIAPLGNNVTLKCNLTIPADVLQITWQKVQGSIPKNIGTYSSQYGGKIFPPYDERIHHSSAELTSSSMTIYNVTLEDDACYKCLFNVFPDGIHGGQMCFSVQNVSELRIECHPRPDEGILIAICSATGKPAPHINFSHESLLMESPKEHIDENPDGIANVTKWYNISLEAMRSLKLWNVSCDMDHPLKKIKKHVCFPQESKPISYYSSLRVHKYLMASLLMCPLTFIICFLIFKIKRI